MKITLLGTGTSQGVPVIGCRCDACLSLDPWDNRLRSGVLLEEGQVNILIDTGPDLRQQMLKHKVEKIDAILYTHEHNDHVVGLDDIRPFNFKQKADMPIYGLERVLSDISRRFAYVFSERTYPGAPRAQLNIIKDFRPFEIFGLTIIPISVMHGDLPILGYRIGDFSFITDASLLTKESMDIIKGSKVLVLNALHKEKHYSHYNLEEALELIDQLKPNCAYLTHISHRMGPAKEWKTLLPPNVLPAYDGLVIEI